MPMYPDIARLFAFSLRTGLRILPTLIVLLTARTALAADTPYTEALEALTDYEAGASRVPLDHLERIIAANRDNPRAIRRIAADLTALLPTHISDDLKAYLCTQLAEIGTETNVAGISRLLYNQATVDAARAALEKIPGERATEALRDALPASAGAAQAGIAESLGRRGDEKSIDALAALASGADTAVAEAAIGALGAIGSLRADRVLARLKVTADVAETAVGTARLHCAATLARKGRTRHARRIYRELAESGPEAIRAEAAQALGADE